VITLHDGYEIDDDPARVDRDAVWEFLSTQAYWGRWRARADLETQVAVACLPRGRAPDETALERPAPAR
jgi:hypothetical protein